MDIVTITISIMFLISLVFHLRRWFGRGGGRIKLASGWVQVTRKQLADIFEEMTPAENQALQQALQDGDTVTAEAILATVTVRYFHKQSEP